MRDLWFLASMRVTLAGSCSARTLKGYISTSSQSSSTGEDSANIVGPVGVGTTNLVPNKSTLAYRIDFENDPISASSVQQATISEALDANLDPNTFQLTSIAFGGHVISLPAGTHYYQGTVDFTEGGQRLEVKIEAGINAATDEVFADFETLDPGIPKSCGSARHRAHISEKTSPPILTIAF